MRRRDFITLVGGAAMSWPLSGPTQQPTILVIGFLSALSAKDSARMVAAFGKGIE